MSKKKILFNLILFTSVIIVFLIFQKMDFTKKVDAHALPEFSASVYKNLNKIKTDQIGVSLLTKNTLKDKALFINFWATWCGSCESEKKYISELWKKYESSNKINFISVVTEDKFEDFEKSEKTKKIEMALVFDHEGSLQEKFKISAVPTTILADSNGTICKYFDQAIDEDDLIEIKNDLEILSSGGSCKLLKQKVSKADETVDEEAIVNNHAKKKKISKEKGQPLFVPKFDLINSDNKSFSQENLKGHVWVANFIFTSCQSSCPVLTKKMKKLESDFKKSKKLKFLSFSVDPKRDTPFALKQYAKDNKIDTSRWTFLTGEWRKIQNLLTNGFKVTGADEPVFHTDRFVLIDSNLKIRGFYATSTKRQRVKLKKDLLYLLHEQ